MGREYILEKLKVAEDCFAEGKGDARSRLLEAYRSALVRLRPEDFSGDRKSQFLSVIQLLKRKPPRFDEYTKTKQIASAVEESMRSCKNKTAVQSIKKIREIYKDVLRSCDEK